MPSNEDAPYRLCCGQHHFGSACPTQKVRCGVCLRMFDPSQMAENTSGELKFCKNCFSAEQRVKEINKAVQEHVHRNVFEQEIDGV